jgi:hypothetical protein
MDSQRIFEMVVSAQSVTPSFKENQRVLSILAGLRRELSVIEEPFTYISTFTALAVGGNQTVQIPIQADADFKLLATTYQANLAGAVQTASTYQYPNVTVLLTDTGNGRQLMSGATPLTSLFGNGQLPFIWPVPKILAARSSLQVQIFSQEAAVTPIIILSFIGVKLYPLPGGQGNTVQS